MREDEAGEPQAEDRTVFVLGAGFSRAIHLDMPLTDELGNDCLPRVIALPGQTPHAFSGGAFETYLSTLAVDQPYLSISENMRNRALFEEFSRAIGDVLGERQNTVLATPPPPWLFEFLLLAHATRSAVITFNYDTLIECLSASGVGPLDEPSFNPADPPFPWMELTGDQPAWPPGPAILGSDPVQTMRLLKLHGSLNWYWTPGDDTGATLAKRKLPGSWLAPEPYVETDRQRTHPGRVPFVVPPTATKSSFYASPQLSEVWRRARTELSEARQVVMLGYSLPPTDITTSAMFRAAAVAPPTFTVADISPKLVKERLLGLGVPADRVWAHALDGREPIPDVVADFSKARSKFVLGDIVQGGADEEALAVAWGNLVHAGVTALKRDGADLVLRIEPPQDRLAYVAKSRGDADHQLSKVSELRAHVGSTLFVELPDGSRQPLLDHAHRGIEYGSSASWRVLRAPGPPPELSGRQL